MKLNIFLQACFLSVTAAISTLTIILTVTPALWAAQSTITESEGYACMGDDKSRKQTEQAAVEDAKRKAAESVSSYIKSETATKDLELIKDLVSAYSNATVKVIQEIEKRWYKEPSMGDCYRLKIKAEVIPDERAMENVAKATDNPSAPLHVKVWSDHKEYKSGDKIKIYLRGNKPFYARVLYKNARGEALQLLPNPYRKENYFNGGVVYEIPAGNDRFDLEVSPPFGEEYIRVYASTSPLGELALQSAEGVYRVKTESQDIGAVTRGVKLKEKPGGNESSASEFFEDAAIVRTSK
ncbi:MAG: DUF4384 domain-containing protein [Nitrospirae bacterium]|nr:DUF4384 domain-containing protein [Nitrospirota bacterium]